jgi:uncharacterized protein RhaS with RHS repeats
MLFSGSLSPRWWIGPVILRHSERAEHYNYFRDYDVGIGRYIESDPIGLRGGPNTYTYVGNNPLRSKDVTSWRLGTALGGRWTS